MITYQDLQEAIAECEGQKNPNANTCIKLAAFYTILNNLYPDNEQLPQARNAVVPTYSYASAPSYVSDSEFGRVVERMDYDKVMAVMDELMSTLEILNPKLYDGVLRKLSD